MVWSVLTEPVFTGAFRAMLEVTRDPRPPSLEDESIASFTNRRFGGPQIGDNIVSAVIHGIYAGDIYQLSAKSIFRRLWDFEHQHGSVTEGAAVGMQSTMAKAKRDISDPKTDISLRGRLKGASVYTFKEGIGQLSAALEASLRTNPNVEFKIGDKVTSVEYDTESDGISVRIPCTPHTTKANTR